MKKEIIKFIDQLEQGIDKKNLKKEKYNEI